MELLKTSWPFDSDPNPVRDDDGYLIYDRAVGADTLQRTFDKLFSDGVFSTSDFRISAASGLSVNIQPGMCIINGGMAGWWDEPKVVALSATAPQWLTHYAIFLRYDNNDDMRGIYLRIDASAAGASVPEPVSEANVTELRIGYVTVPANATDLSGATFHNEVGTRFAPVTTPLFDIDVTAVLEDLRERADEAYQAYYDLLISAVEGTTAGHLQAQINAQEERIAGLEGKEIDPLALRAEMGLGSDGGVLGVPYGGTGVDNSKDLKAMVNTDVFEFSFNATLNVPSPGSGNSATSPEVSIFSSLGDGECPWFAKKTSDGLLEITASGSYIVCHDTTTKYTSQSGTGSATRWDSYITGTYPNDSDFNIVTNSYGKGTSNVPVGTTSSSAKSENDYIDSHGVFLPSGTTLGAAYATAASGGIATVFSMSGTFKIIRL